MRQLERGKNLSPEAFAQFLTLLSPDPEEAAVLYARLHQKLAGFFNLKGISDPHAAADETIDRAVQKIDAGTPVPDINKYCFGIARNIARERRRFMYRETLAFREFVEGLGNNTADLLERIEGLLRPCFEQLSVEERQLLLAYCQEIRGRARAEYRRQLAETLQMTVLALRVRVTRLRSNLTDCVRKRSNAFERAPQ